MLKRRRPESEVDPAIVAEAANKHVLHEALTQHRQTATLLAIRAKNNEGLLTADVIGDVISASLVSEWEIDPALLVAQLNRWLETRLDDSQGDGHTAGAEVAEGAFRFEEYATFCRDGQEGMPKINLLVRSHSMVSYAPVVRDRFSRIALLDKLRETRAFVGYSRLFAASSQDSDKRWKLISRARKNWLPAVVVRGEGIFLVFDGAKLDRWQSAHGEFHRERLLQVNRNVHAQASRRETHASDVDPK